MGNTDKHVSHENVGIGIMLTDQKGCQKFCVKRMKIKSSRNIAQVTLCSFLCFILSRIWDG